MFFLIGLWVGLLIGTVFGAWWASRHVEVRQFDNQAREDELVKRILREGSL